MSEMIKYAVECSSIYGVYALLILCASLVCAVAIFAKLVQYITNKVTCYDDVSTKASYKEASFEAELHERNKNRT